MQKGITFNGKHSFNDLGLLLDSFTIGQPAKRKVLAQIPYSNQQFDFSAVLGLQPYDRRQLTFNFNFFETDDVRKFYQSRMGIVNWLQSIDGEQVLQFDEILNYHFMAEVRTAPETVMNWDMTGTLKVVFDCYPFMISNRYEGNDVFDEFNFDTDIAQMAAVSVKGWREIHFYNVGTVMSNVIIESSANITIEKDGESYTLTPGANDIVGFALDVGENIIRATGTGTLQFLFRKEML